MTLRELKIQIMIRLNERNIPEEEWYGIVGFTRTKKTAIKILEYLDEEPATMEPWKVQDRIAEIQLEMAKIQID